MIEEKLKLPFYAKASVFLIGIFVLFTILYLLRSIIVPIVFATIIAIVLHPFVNFFVKLKINRILAIAITLLITFLVIASFGYLIYTQAIRFSNSWPMLVEKFTDMINHVVAWVSSNADIKPKDINEWLTKTTGELFNTGTNGLKQTLISVGTAVMVLLLIPFYIFMILFYHPILIEFIRRLFGTNNRSQVSEIVTQIKTVIQRYLVGLIIEAVLMAVMEIVTLLLLGIEYAVLLGILGALLNVIPYIGGLVAVALPMMIALATKSTPMYAIYILIIYYIIQLIDNHYIVPIVVASKVKINALFSVIVVFAGNALWGIPGMFLSIPLLGIVKLICDNIEPLKPWGFLLGDTMPSVFKIKLIIKKLKKNPDGTNLK